MVFKKDVPNNELLLAYLEMGVYPARTVLGQEPGNDDFSLDRSDGSPETVCSRQLRSGQD